MTHLWFYTVHWPMEAPEPLLKKYANRKGPGLNDARYGAVSYTHLPLPTILLV